jgi:hypothetical protein
MDEKSSNINNTNANEQESKEEQKKIVEVQVSQEEKKKFLEDLVFKGTTTYKKEFFDGKLVVEYRSLTGQDQLEIEAKLPTVKGSPAKVMHTYSIWLLSYSLIKYGDTDLTQLEREQRFDFIARKSNSLIDLLSAGHNEFHKKLQACISGEVVDEVFFETPSTS